MCTVFIWLENSFLPFYNDPEYLNLLYQVLPSHRFFFSKQFQRFRSVIYAVPTVLEGKYRLISEKNTVIRLRCISQDFSGFGLVKKVLYDTVIFVNKNF